MAYPNDKRDKKVFDFFIELIDNDTMIITGALVVALLHKQYLSEVVTGLFAFLGRGVIKNART